MDDGQRFSALKKLSCLHSQHHIVLKFKNTPFTIFVWRGKVYWDNIETGETLTMEEVFDNLPELAQQEILFNLDLFR